MFRLTKKTLAAVLAACALPVTAADDVFLLDPAATAVCELVLADDAIPAEKTAAALLGRHLGEMLPGVRFPVVRESAPRADGARGVYVGSTKALRAAGFDVSGWGPEEELIVARGGALFIAGGRPRGARYAAADFLEALGVIVAADDTEVNPRLAKLEWRRPLYRREPAFKARYTATPAIAQSRLNAFNKYNGYRCGDDGQGGYAAYGRYGDCHTFVRYSKEMPTDDPALFAMVKGTRRVPAKAGVKAPLCPSNPKTLAFFLDSLEADVARSLKADPAKRTPPRYYEISMDDELTVCECPDCLRIAREEGCYAGVMLRLVNPLAKRLAELDPAAKLTMLVYQKTLDYPKKTRPEPNVQPRVCVHDREWIVNVKAETVEPVTSPHNADFRATLEAWAGATASFGIWEYWEYYTKGAFPYIAPRAYVENLRWYKAHRAENVLIEIEQPCASFYAFKNWLALKLMDAPSVPYATLRDRFFSAYYGAASAPMKGYLALLTEAVEKECARAPMGGRGVSTYAYLDVPFYRAAYRFLAEAEAAVAGDARSRRHVRAEYSALDRSLLRRDKAGVRAALGIARGDLLARLLDCERAHLKGIYPPNAPALARALRRTENFVAGESIDAPIPPDVKGETVFDFKFNAFYQTSTQRLVDDPDALGGKAIQIVDTGKMKRPFHVNSLSAGTYNHSLPPDKRAGAAFRLTDIPQDEKYHLYHLGRSVLVNGSRIWVHWTWYFQFPPREAYTATPDYESDVWISVKLTGPTYVKGSTKPDGVFIDRVIIAR